MNGFGKIGVEKVNKKIYLLSYPHSGSNWLTYCIERIFKCKVVGATPKYTIFCHANENFRTDIEIYKGHGHTIEEKQEGFIEQFDGVILLVRKFDQCMASFKEPQLTPSNVVNSWFFKNVNYFDSLECDKILIRYEKLMLNFQSEISNLGYWLNHFVDVDYQNSLDEYWQNKDNENDRCLQMYSRNGKTKSNTLSTQEYIENKNGIEEFIGKYYPNLTKYFERI